MRKRRSVIVLVILGVLGLCVGGMILPGKVLPVISMAAERLPLFGTEIPNTLPTTFLAMLILLAIALAYRLSLRQAERSGRRSGLALLIESIVEAGYGMVENIAGKEYAPAFFPLIATFFLFILIANWLGLLPGVGSIGMWAEHHGETVLVPFLRAANADLSTTLALGLVSVIAAQYFGFRFQGPRYLRKFFNFSAPRDAGKLRPLLMISNGFVGILELVSELIKIFSFAFRLFGNIFAGEVLLIVVAYLATFIVSLPFMGLELFVGFVQAMIFSMLSLIFFTLASHPHGEEKEHH